MLIIKNMQINVWTSEACNSGCMKDINFGGKFEVLKRQLAHYASTVVALDECMHWCTQFTLFFCFETFSTFLHTHTVSIVLDSLSLSFVRKESLIVHIYRGYFFSSLSPQSCGHIFLFIKLLDLKKIQSKFVTVYLFVREQLSLIRWNIPRSAHLDILAFRV